MAETPIPEAEKKTAKAPPYGPGMLMVFGLALLALALWCFYDLFVGGAGKEWAVKGNQGTIMFNYAGMIGGALGAVYAFVLAAVRARKKGDADAGGQTGGPGQD